MSAKVPKKQFTFTTDKEHVRCQTCRKLELEKNQLQKELADQRACYAQLLEETALENYDTRRVNLLKAQILQLERQVLLLNQTTLSYSDLCSQVRTIKDSSISKINYIIEQPKQSPQLISQLEAIKEDILKLKDKHKVFQPCHAVYAGRYSNKERELSLLDAIIEPPSGMDINNISWLEGQIHQLYCGLIQLEASLRVIPSSGTLPTLSSLDPVYSNAKKLHSLTKVCLDQSGLVAQELLTLSLQVPLQYQQKLKKKCYIDVKQLLNELPPFLKNKQQGRDLITTLVTTTNGIHQKLTEKNELLEAELIHHRQIYSDHLQYMEAVFRDIKSSHKVFVSSLNSALKAPLQNIIDAYCEDEKGLVDNAVLIESLCVNIPMLKDTLERLEEMMMSCTTSDNVQILKSSAPKI